MASMGRYSPRPWSWLSSSLLPALLVAIAVFHLLPSVRSTMSNVSVVRPPLFQPGSPSPNFTVQVSYTSNVTSGNVTVGYFVLDLNQSCCVSYGAATENFTSPSNGTLNFTVVLSTTPATAVLGVKAFVISTTDYIAQPFTASTSTLASVVQPISVLPNNTIQLVYSPAALPSAQYATFPVVVRWTSNLYWTSLYVQCDTVQQHTPPRHGSSVVLLGGDCSHYARHPCSVCFTRQVYSNNPALGMGANLNVTTGRSAVFIYALHWRRFLCAHDCQLSTCVCACVTGALSGTLNLTSNNSVAISPYLPIQLYAYWGTNAARSAASNQSRAAATVVTSYVYLLSNALVITHSPAYVSPYPNAQTLVVTLNYTANISGNGNYLSTDGNQIVMLCQRTVGHTAAAANKCTLHFDDLPPPAAVSPCLVLLRGVTRHSAVLSVVVCRRPRGRQWEHIRVRCNGWDIERERLTKHHFRRPVHHPARHPTNAARLLGQP